MHFALTPDITTSSLSISNAPSGNPLYAVTQFGGGGTPLRQRPQLYLEGNLALSRFDPVYVVSNGVEQGAVSVRWSSTTATGGVGYDYRIAENLSLKPIAVLSLGRVSSDLRLPDPFPGAAASREVDFLRGGSLNVYGIGGSLMLDYERQRSESEIDFEARYNAVHLSTFNGDDPALDASYLARSASIWARYRAPTGVQALDRPLRYVVELAASNYFGRDGNRLGFDWLGLVGIGLKLDSTKYTVLVTRTRLMLRYITGDGIEGVSVGLALSF